MRKLFIVGCVFMQIYGLPCQFLLIALLRLKLLLVTMCRWVTAFYKLISITGYAGKFLHVSGINILHNYIVKSVSIFFRSLYQFFIYCSMLPGATITPLAFMQTAPEIFIPLPIFTALEYPYSFQVLNEGENNQPYHFLTELN